MKVNNTFLILSLIFINQLVFSQKETNCNNKSKEAYSNKIFTVTASLFAGIIKSHNDGNIHILKPHSFSAFLLFLFPFLFV